MPNRLLSETSPYLLQHAHNPVDWYPWGSEAFAKAKAENKPVVVSIGYAACHWCHVMERESFENPEIAAKMNSSFVSIKVDREERPDVDAIYMQTLVSIAGHGGWPLNVFLMPDGRPFYAGSYFPDTDRGQMPSWPRVLDSVSDAFRNKPDLVAGNAKMLTDALHAAAEQESADEPITSDIPDFAYHALADSFDPEGGGFGGAPKFPQTMPQEFLLRYHLRTGNTRARELVEHSLQCMAAGGIYDHLGGGFARYSTDDQWLVPHFEKMLYDNALLATIYTQAYQLTGSLGFRAVAQETLDYLLRDLRHTNGAFFSSQDADSEGVEGKYYVWAATEIDEVLGVEDGAQFSSVYGLDQGPNFEGKNILYLANGLNDPARETLLNQRASLLAKRGQRIAPATDDKVLTSWNGLAIRALAEAGAAMDEIRFTEAASQAADAIFSVMRPNGRLLRTWKGGKAHINGYLEDYAFLINGLLSLHAATFEHRWLHAADELANEMISLFWDQRQEGFYDIGSDSEKLIVRPRDQFDNAIPCGSSAAAEALLRLGVLKGEERYTRMASRILRAMVPLLARAPMGFGNWLKVIELYLAKPSEVVIIGDPSADDTRALLRTLHSGFQPNRIVIGMASNMANSFTSPLLEGKKRMDGNATAYVCSGYQCDLPTSNPVALALRLQISFAT